MKKVWKNDGIEIKNYIRKHTDSERFSRRRIIVGTLAAETMSRPNTVELTVLMTCTGKAQIK